MTWETLFMRKGILEYTTELYRDNLLFERYVPHLSKYIAIVAATACSEILFPYKMIIDHCVKCVCVSDVKAMIITLYIVIY